MPDGVVTHIGAQLFQNFLAAAHGNQHHDVGVLLGYEFHAQRNVAAVLHILGLVRNVHSAQTLCQITAKALFGRHIETVRRAEDDQHLRSPALLYVLCQRDIFLFYLRTLGGSFLFSAGKAAEVVYAFQHVLIGVYHVQIKRHAGHFQRLAQHYVEGYVGAYNQIRLQAHDFFQIRRMDHAYFGDVLNAFLDVIGI